MSMMWTIMTGNVPLNMLSYSAGMPHRGGETPKVVHNESISSSSGREVG